MLSSVAKWSAAYVDGVKMGVYICAWLIREPGGHHIFFAGSGAKT